MRLVNWNNSLNRINWIDVAKGIGIILVVLSHLTINGQILRKVIFSFHMPLFFFLSGLVLKINISFKEYLMKRLKGIYFPFLYLLIFDYFCGFIINIARYGFSISMFKDICLAFLKSVSGTCLIQNGYTFNLPIWFLCVLFFAEMFLYFVLMLPRNVLFVLLPVCVVSSLFVNDYLPFCISYFPTVLVFMISSFLVRDYILYLDKNVIFKKTNWIIIFVALFISFVLVYVISNENEIISMQTLDFGNPILFYICAFLGINSIIIIAMLMESTQLSKILIYFGENSIIIMCTHFYFCRMLLPCIIELIGLSEYLYCFFIEIILSLLVMVIMIPIIYFTNKYMYFIFGRKRIDA